MAATTKHVIMVQCISSLFCSNLIMNSVSVCYEQFQLLELSHFKICINLVKLVPQSA
jgi:hypothetical protein